MIIYATHKGGRYLPLSESIKEMPEGKRGIYINITNQCNCNCTFCLRSMKEMREDSSLWMKKQPTLEEYEAALSAVPFDWDTYVSEVVLCGFGEPTLRLDVCLGLLRFVKEKHPNTPTRMNTNGLGELANGREFASEFKGILDTVSISLNASNAKRYYELTRAEYGEKSFEAMLTFAEHCKPYVPNVVMTIVDHVENEEEIALCKKICAERKLKLRVRVYEDS